MLVESDKGGLRPDRSLALPGEPGIWIFILADMAAFALFFAVFTLSRMVAPALYERSRLALNIDFGVANTIILLTSSWMMVQAVHAARLAHRRRTLLFLMLTLLIGSGFAVTKIAEYSAKFGSGISMLTNEFFMYYFVLTGIHFLHFVLGMIAIAFMLAMARSRPLDHRFLIWIETVGSYWHMVDLLWIMLFPLLYLQRAA